MCFIASNLRFGGGNAFPYPVSCAASPRPFLDHSGPIPPSDLFILFVLCRSMWVSIPAASSSRVVPFQPPPQNTSVVIVPKNPPALKLSVEQPLRNIDLAIPASSHSNKRPDVLLFLNGIPVVIVELKSPSREETDASEAYLQLRNYMHEIPSMFVYNAICVMSDMGESRAGTITSSEDRFMEWKTVDGSYENTQYAQFDTFFEGMFQKERLLDIIKNFICFSNEGVNSFKIFAGYHQYFAVNKAIVSTKEPPLMVATARVAYSGTPRAAASPYRWCSMLIFCRKLWIARQLLFLQTAMILMISSMVSLQNVRSSCDRNRCMLRAVNT